MLDFVVGTRIEVFTADRWAVDVLCVAGSFTVFTRILGGFVWEEEVDLAVEAVPFSLFEGEDVLSLESDSSR